MQTLSDIEKEVDNLTDEVDEPVDANIKHAVIAMRYAGFRTTASCEGHLDHGFPYPWIDTQYVDGKIRRSEKKRLKRLLKQFYKYRKSSHQLLLQNFADYRLQSVKWPRSAKKRRAHTDVLDEDLLREYQKEMDDFADFLIDSIKRKSLV